MKIIQTIEVRQIVTEKSKQALREAFLAQKQQLMRECEQLRFEQKRLEKPENILLPFLSNISPKKWIQD